MNDSHGWIRVENELPPFGVKVLLLGSSVGNGYHMIGQRRENEPAFFFLSVGSIHQTCVTHWQPLPGLPEEE